MNEDYKNWWDQKEVKKEGKDARGNPDLGGEIGFSSDAWNCNRDHTNIKATRKIFFLSLFINCLKK